jgi:hypothetical protein
LIKGLCLPLLHQRPAAVLLLPLLLLPRLGGCCSQVVLGSSIPEALAWAEQNLDAPAAKLVKDALALKDKPFSSE